MNQLLIPTAALVALLMAGCGDSPDWQKNTSDQGTAPTAPDTSPSESKGSMQ